MIYGPADVLNFEAGYLLLHRALEFMFNELINAHAYFFNEAKLTGHLMWTY